MGLLPSVYQPKEYEDRIYQFWLDKGYFRARREDPRPTYTILMPPPNVTAALHMGHGTGYTMQDVLVRWQRMQGCNTLWLPGTDHAGIATQMMVEKSLEEEGKTRQDLGREEFVKRLWAWKDQHGGTILEQIKAMGWSCDWDRLAFTMDDNLSKAVRKIFVTLFEEGLIYRGKRLVNWDPVLRTAISDDEIENKEISGHLWRFRYPLADGMGHVIIATTRPETMLGDTAVAVHPDDDRYRDIIGKEVVVPIAERKVRVIADDYVKSDFGTGCLKITPAHDANDFAIGQRHQLDLIDIFNDDATLNDRVPEQYRGLDRFVARKKIISELKEKGLFEDEEKYKHVVPHSERSKQVIEPRLSEQWYVDMKGLAQPALAAAEKGDLRFYPDSWKKTYFHWLENIQDWCISRQLWWGHRIPIWYCQDCSEVTTGLEDPESCRSCQSQNLKQDDDVLDTWFSSWLWPLSPLGWPDDDKDLGHFYPSNVLVTAPEIIFLWVARMVMVGLKVKGEIPFQDVFLTATVCDKKGRKFSKTLGNGIEPMEVIDKHGADAVRFTAVHLAPLGGRIRMDRSDFEIGARFINKIWNAARFLLNHISDDDAAAADRAVQPLHFPDLDRSGKWLVHRLAETADAVSQSLGNYRINDAVHAAYHYIWDDFCDWGLETAKDRLRDDHPNRDQTISLLVYCLDGVLRLLSPIMPFVTEEIWQKLPPHPDWDRGESLIVASFPDGDKISRDQVAADEWSRVQQMIGGVRAVRTQAQIAPKTQLACVIKTTDSLRTLFSESQTDICRLANLSEIRFDDDRPGQCLVDVGKGFVTYIPAEGLIDVAAERSRLDNELKRIDKILKGIEAKLANTNFVARAPAEVIEQTESQLKNMSHQREALRANLDALK